MLLGLESTLYHTPFFLLLIYPNKSTWLGGSRHSYQQERTGKGCGDPNPLGKKKTWANIGDHENPKGDNMEIT